MGFRTDLDDLMIPLTSFQGFDHRKSIEMLIPETHKDLQPRDKMYWYCGSFWGTVEILSCQGEKMTVKKIS